MGRKPLHPGSPLYCYGRTTRAKEPSPGIEPRTSWPELQNVKSFTRTRIFFLSNAILLHRYIHQIRDILQLWGEVGNRGEPWFHPLTCVRATYKGTIKDEMFPPATATRLPKTYLVGYSAGIARSHLLCGLSFSDLLQRMRPNSAGKLR